MYRLFSVLFFLLNKVSDFRLISMHGSKRKLMFFGSHLLMSQQILCRY